MSSHPDCDPDWLAKNSTSYTHSSSVVVRSVVESKPGAAIKVERIELTEAGRKMLEVQPRRGMQPEPTWLIVLVCSVLACVSYVSLACHTGLIACN
jgi:hypothetical protein